MRKLLDVLKAIQKLTIEQEKGRNWCGIEVGARGYSGSWDRDIEKEPFRVTLWNDGFEATRNLSRDELEAIRDWAADALAKTAEESLAA